MAIATALEYAWQQHGTGYDVKFTRHTTHLIVQYTDVAEHVLATLTDTLTMAKTAHVDLLTKKLIAHLRSVFSSHVEHLIAYVPRKKATGPQSWAEFCKPLTVGLLNMLPDIDRVLLTVMDEGSPLLKDVGNMLNGVVARQVASCVPAVLTDKAGGTRASRRLALRRPDSCREIADELARVSAAAIWDQLGPTFLIMRPALHLYYIQGLQITHDAASLCNQLTSELQRCATDNKVMARGPCYVYAYVDGADIFYIGKGSGARCLAHVLDATCDVASVKVENKRFTKLAHLRSMWQMGHVPRIVHVARNLSSDMALMIENLIVRSSAFQHLTNVPNHTQAPSPWTGLPTVTNSRLACTAVAMTHFAVKNAVQAKPTAQQTVHLFV